MSIDSNPNSHSRENFKSRKSRLLFHIRLILSLQHFLNFIYAYFLFYSGVSGGAVG